MVNLSYQNDSNLVYTDYAMAITSFWDCPSVLPFFPMFPDRSPPGLGEPPGKATANRPGRVLGFQMCLRCFRGPRSIKNLEIPLDIFRYL